MGVALLATVAFACTGEDPIVTGDAGTPPDEMDAGATDMARPDTGPPPPPVDMGPPAPRFEGLPFECWLPRNSFCNPANNDGCAPDEACDIAVDEQGQPIVMCFPPPAEQQLGEVCDNSAGPFCAGGLRCMGGECRDTCCEHSECSGGERCVPLDPLLGTLGICADDAGPTCAPPGGRCSRPSDCCSNVCHIDHCH